MFSTKIYIYFISPPIDMDAKTADEPGLDSQKVIRESGNNSMRHTGMDRLRISWREFRRIFVERS